MKLDFVECEGMVAVYIDCKHHSRRDLLGAVVECPEMKCWVWKQGRDIIMSSKLLQKVIDKLRELDGGALI